MSEGKKYQFFDLPTNHRSQVGTQDCLTLKLPTDMRYVASVDQMLRSLCQLTDPRAAQEKYRDDLTAALRECCSHLIDKLHNPRLQFEIRFTLCNNRIEIDIEEPREQEAVECDAETKNPEKCGYALHLIQNRVDKVSFQANDSRKTLKLVKYFIMPPCNI